MSDGQSGLSDSFRTAVITARAKPPQTNVRTPSMVTQVAVVTDAQLRMEEDKGADEFPGQSPRKVVGRGPQIKAVRRRSGARAGARR